MKFRIKNLRGAFDSDIQLGNGKTFKDANVNDVIKEVKHAQSEQLESCKRTEREGAEGSYHTAYHKT